MASTTGEHIDELEARRRRRDPLQPTVGADARLRSGAAARDLLRDLVAAAPTGEHEARSAEAPSATQPGTVDDSTAVTEPPAEVKSRRTSGVDAEDVDELVRRVQASNEAAPAET